MKIYEQFHDGTLDGLLIDPAVTQIFLSTYERESFVIAASGVVRLAAGKFKEGNIILDVSVRQHEELTLQDITGVYELNTGAIGEDVAEKLLERAREQKLVILETSSSYGASCVVLAKSVDFLRRSEWADRYLAGTV